MRKMCRARTHVRTSRGLAVASARPAGGRRIRRAALSSVLFVAFGVVALLIAVVGIYATTAYGLSKRGREMNIRVALGARTSQVIGRAIRS